MEGEASGMHLIIGGDKTPLHYYRCDVCGTIALEDTSGQERVPEFGCPTCHNIGVTHSHSLPKSS